MPLPVLRVVRERTADYDRRRAVSNVDDLARAVRAVLADADRETFVVLHLDTKHNVMSAEVVAVGTLSATLVHPREVFKGAILANAARVALGHNHPSGDPTPSPEDHALTRKLIEAGQILGVPVVDHVVVGDGTGRHVSIREQRPSLEWAP